MTLQRKLAVITGGTSGIGESFAYAYGAKGYDLWLIGRNQTQLEKVSKDIEKTCGVQVAVIICDLGDPKNIEELSNKLAKADKLEVLINNAGYAGDGTFHEMPFEEHAKQLNVHITATTHLSHTALKIMAPNRKGTIITVCSVASFLPTPSSPLYGPTKSYLKTFTETLAISYKDQGIRIQALCPGFTITNFHTRLGMNPKDVYFEKGFLRAYTSNEVVAKSLEDLEKNVIISIPGSNYKLLVHLARRLPFNLLYFLLGQRKRLSRYKI